MTVRGAYARSAFLSTIPSIVDFRWFRSGPPKNVKSHIRGGEGGQQTAG